MTEASGQELGRFLQLLGRDSRLQAQVRSCITADEVALIAQDYGFSVTGDQLLLRRVEMSTVSLSSELTIQVNILAVITKY